MLKLMTKRQQYLVVLAWSLSLITVFMAIMVWGSDLRWQFNKLSSYRLFPLFGLIAFSLMWCHYIIAALRLYLKVPKGITKSYFEVTSLAVLAAILAHPGLLWWQLWQDGFGLPPFSYLEHYVAKKLAWVAILGTISLVIFLAYEFRRFYGDRTWWRYVQYASDVAMLLIVYHGLRLGKNIQDGWFVAIWYLYAVTLIISLGYIYWQKFSPDTAPVAKTSSNQQ